MEERGESSETIEQRIALMQDFMDAMESNPDITLCNNGPDNRSNSANDFIQIIDNAILDISKNH